MVEASDGGVPERIATLTLYIEVDRSTRQPRFVDAPLNPVRISENLPVDDVIMTVAASDPDVKVVRRYKYICLDSL